MFRQSCESKVPWRVSPLKGVSQISLLTFLSLQLMESDQFLTEAVQRIRLLSNVFSISSSCTLPHVNLMGATFQAKCYSFQIFCSAFCSKFSLQTWLHIPCRTYTTPYIIAASDSPLPDELVHHFKNPALTVLGLR